jgi:hypothetical protein
VREGRGDGWRRKEGGAGRCVPRWGGRKLMVKGGQRPGNWGGAWVTRRPSRSGDGDGSNAKAVVGRAEGAGAEYQSP